MKLNHEQKMYSDFSDFMADCSVAQRYIGQVAFELGISETELKIMTYLKLHSDGVGRMEIANFYGVLKSNLSRAVSRLIKEELVVLENHSVGKMRGKLFLTDKGHNLLSELHDVIISEQPSQRPFDTYLRLTRRQLN